MNMKLSIVAVAIALIAPQALAATTTYVATHGYDANPCSIAQPCRSFAGALLQTASGGEIVVLDSRGYGPVQIDKSVSIVAPEGIYAGISVFTGNGVEITGAATRVRLSGLTIVVVGGAADLYGVNARVPVHLSIERVVISAFGDSSAGMVLCGAGFDCVHPGTGEVRIVDSMMYSNNTGISAPEWRAVVERSIFAKGGIGVRGAVSDSLFAFDSGLELNSFGTAGDGGSVRQSVFSDSAYRVFAAIGWGSAPVEVSLSRNVFVRSLTGFAIGTGLGGATAIDIDSCVIVDNQEYGIEHTSNDPSANATLSNNTIARNAIGGVLNAYGAPIHSRGNNTIRNNGVDGGPFVPLPGR